MTNYVVFENKGTFDLRLIKTFGVNVKPNTDSPIGYFGTGLKYAAAVILRNGGSFVIQDGEGYTFELVTEKENIRGKEFPLVKIKTEKGNTYELAFTTELGKNWMPWHAYRELYSNCLDENGSRYEQAMIPAPRKGVVRFIIKSEPFLEVFYNHGDYFFDPSKHTKIGEDDFIEVYDRPTKSFFFRGINVLENNVHFRYTYNAKKGISLSEDRLSKYSFERDELIKSFWMQNCSNKSALENFVTLDNSYPEMKIDYSTGHMSKDMLEVASMMMDKRYDKVNNAIRKNVHGRRSQEDKFKKVNLTNVQEVMLERAKNILEKNFDYNFQHYPIIPIKGTGDILGMADDGKIYISISAFDKGMKEVIKTLMEEYIHLEHLVLDCTRAMQNVLFDKLVNMMEEKYGEPF